MNNRSVMQYLVRSAVSGALLIAGFGVLAQEAAQPSGAPAAASAPAATPAMISQGQGLFFGNVRFSGGGPACNACHNLTHPASVGGGTLAMDLTESFGRLGSDGIIETLPRKGAQSPFPVMQAAFQGRDITVEESNALAAFLQDAHAKGAQQTTNLGSKMLLAGIGGVVILLLLFSLIGQGRKRRSVNQEVFDRQVMSE